MLRLWKLVLFGRRYLPSANASGDYQGKTVTGQNSRAENRQAQVEHLFHGVGCNVALQKVDKRSANVICELSGETPRTILVGSHYDFVDQGHGIVDDWSGTALLASLYEILRPVRRRHTYRFVAFAGEEQGLVGSLRYVKDLRQDRSPFPVALVNLECRGFASPKVWA